MRQMRSSMPMFLLIGLALIAVIGVTIFQYSATAAVAEVNTTVEDETDELSLGIFTMEYGIIFGLAAVLFIVALYFALKTLI